MSYDTMTIFVDTVNKRAYNCGLACNFPSSIIDLMMAYKKHIMNQWVGSSNINFDWVPENAELIKGGIIDTTGVDAIAVCCIDHENPMMTAVTGVTYNVCTCGCSPVGEIREKMFPQGCTIIYTFERRVKDYVRTTRKLKVKNLVKLLTKYNKEK